MKIAFIGKSCSGKTWCVDFLNNYRNKNLEKEHTGADDSPFYITRFAKMVKHIATELFFMTVKDRHLLQQIGTKMREIRDDVYVNYVIHECEGKQFCLLDDARYVNEIMRLRDDGWTLVKLDISPELQRERIMRCYPDTYKEHLGRLEHESETQQDSIPLDTYHYIINVAEDDVKTSLIKIYNDGIKC